MKMSERKLEIRDQRVERIEQVERPSKVVVDDKSVHTVKPVEAETGMVATGVVEWVETSDGYRVVHYG